MKKLFRRNVPVAILLAVTMLLSACGSGGTSTKSTGTGTSTDTSTKYRETLIVGINEDLSHFDPHNASGLMAAKILGLMQRSLMDNDSATNALTPAVATEWKAVNDLTWKFTIRDNIRFQNGDTLTFEDIKFSFDRMKRSKQPDVSMIDRLEQIDEKHFYMHLKYPYSIIQYELSGNGFSIISHKSTDDNIIACGPYKLAKHVSGDRIELERFDDFYEETPITKRIIFRIIPETTARVIALETGEIDVADDVPVVERARIAGNPELKLHEVVTSCTEMIYLNCAKGPTSDIRVRQALAMATNREELTLAVTNGTGVPSSTPHPINVPYRYKGEGLPYNPEEAKKLLAEAGYPDGFSLQIVLRNSTHKMIAEMLQAQWKEIGVKVDVQFTEVSTFFDRINNGRFEAYLLVNNNSKGDVYKTLEEFYSPNAGMKGDRMLYKNDRVDKLFDIIKESSDEKKREEAGIEIQKIVMKEVPAIPLFCPTDAIGGRKGVEGIAVSPGRTTYFGDIYMVKAN